MTLEADNNEASAIASEALRLETIDIIGPAGTPDGGYKVGTYKVSPGSSASGVSVDPGIFYLGGWRLELHKKIEDLDSQPDWLDGPSFTLAQGGSAVSLLLTEHSVGAVEDQALREVALGGPDSAARSRLMQHFLLNSAKDCADGAKTIAGLLAADGVSLDPATLQLISSARLQAGFVQGPSSTDACIPKAAGGYLGADNQMVRVTVTQYDAKANTGTLLWGWNNASLLYRAKVINPTTLTLTPTPVDQEHAPQPNQMVEILRASADLGDGNFIAADTGVLALTQAYSFDTGQLTLATQLTDHYLTDQLFVRLWQASVPFTAGNATPLDSTGITVTITMDAPLPAQIAARPFWHFAVRPSMPQCIYPERYSDKEGQPPDGPRQWLCNLAVVAVENGHWKVAEDCRKQFCDLVEACSEKSSGCCTVSLSPADLTEKKTLQWYFDSYSNRGHPIKICLGPGTYELTAPLALGKEHSNFTIEACPGGVTLKVAADSEPNFQLGLITLCEAANVTLRGLTFALPLVPSTLGTGRLVFLIYLSVGLRPVDCPKFSVEDCTFVYFGSKLPGERPLVATGILASGGCVGLRLIGNRFDGVASTFSVPVGLQTGFALFPSSTLLPAAGTNAAISAKFLSSWLDDAVLRDNFFGSLTLPVLVYADFGLVKLESNTVRDSLNGFWFVSLTSVAATFNIANVNVERANLVQAAQLHNGLYYALANPQFQIASAALRGFPLPPNCDLAKAQTISPGPGAAADISRVQDLFDRVLPAAAAVTHTAPETESARVAAAVRVPLTEDLSTLREHPLINILPVPASAVSLNQSFSVIENQAFAAAPAQTSPVAMHINGNDVNAALRGALSGVGLLVVSLGVNNQDTFNLAGNTFIATESSSRVPVDFVLGYFGCAITGNNILNEGGQENALSLTVFAPKGAITGNVLVGAANLYVPPPSLPGVNTWNVFNAI